MAFTGRLLKFVLDAYAFGLVAYVVLTWVQSPEVVRAREWLGRLYKPALVPLQKLIKPIRIGNTVLDLSPVILFFAIGIAERAVNALLFEL